MNTQRLGKRETRAITCPKCDPTQATSDKMEGWDLSLKYLLFGQKCRVCGTELVDLGVIDANSK